MATLTANSLGNISGKFTIPANIPVGAKAIRALGSNGTFGAATFTGRGQITIEERRVINTFVTVETSVTAIRASDPLAQTFTLPEGRHVVGCDLWFTAKGARPILVQLRRTANGVPTADVMAEKRVPASSIVLAGSVTAIAFDTPVWLEAGIEYAIVVLSDDAVTALSVAELGKFDATANKYITSQPFQVGVLLSSSNAITWTPHQDKDLTFRLKAARFTSHARSVSLGTVAVSNLSDIMALYSVDIPATGTSAQLKATAPSGEVFRLNGDQSIALPARITGNVNLSLELAGTDTASPVLYPNIQFIAGNLGETSTYVTRQFPVGSAGRIAVTYEGITPGTSTIVVEYQKPDNSWQPIAITSGVDVGDGWVERSHIVTGITQTNTRIRITMNGTTAQRPQVRKMRAAATA